jgi:hypothetical protein
LKKNTYRNGIDNLDKNKRNAMTQNGRERKNRRGTKEYQKKDREKEGDHIGRRETQGR